MTPEELSEVAAAVAARIAADRREEEAIYERTKAAQAAVPQRITRAQAIAAGLLEEPEPPESSVERRLGTTEEGRTQRVLLASIGIGAALAFGLNYLQVDATPAYSLMAAASAALLGNAWLGGKRQEAKAKVEAVKEGGI